MIEKLNPFLKALTIMLCGILLSFSYSVSLNALVFMVSMILLLCFSKASKKQIVLILILPLLMGAAMFWSGIQNSNGQFGMDATAAVGAGMNYLTALNQSTSIYNALQLFTRVLAFAGLGILFALTTEGEAFIQSLMHQCHMKPKFAYGILAAFHLIPNIAQELSDAKLAYKVRGLGNRFSLKPFFAAMVNCLRWSESVAMAMESKGFDGEGKRTYYKITKVFWYDWIFLAAAVAAVITGMVCLHF